MTGRVRDAVVMLPCMSEPVDDIFTSDVIAALSALRREDVAINGRDVARRGRILASKDPSAPSGMRALRAAWVQYLAAAGSVGLLDDADVRARLSGADDDGFRSALAECATAWFLVQHGFAVQPRPEPSSARGVDLLARAGDLDIYVEVKSPYVPRPNHSWAGDDSDVLLRCIKDAGRGQFKKDRANLLVVVPALRVEIYNDRSQLLKAAIGEDALAIPISLDDTPAPPSYPTFLQTGKLARPRRATDGAFSTDLTRVSAILSLEHRFRHVSDDETEVLHSSVVVHNPFATVPIPPAILGDHPQWVHGDGKMWWSDGYRGP